MREPTAAAFCKMPISKGAAALLYDSENPFAHGAAAASVEIEYPIANGAATSRLKL